MWNLKTNKHKAESHQYESKRGFQSGKKVTKGTAFIVGPLLSDSKESVKICTDVDTQSKETDI